MADVIDIIHNLSFQTSNTTSIKDALELIKSNIAEVNKLEERIKVLSASYKALSDSNNPNADKVNKQLQDTIALRDKERRAIDDTIKTSKPLQDQIAKETGLIGQLQTKLEALRKSRIGATDVKQIQAYTVEIRKAQGQLASLTGEGQGVISQLLGGSGGGIGKQALTGLLTGIGFGGGFGLITKAVSGLVEELGKTDVGIAFGKDIEKLGDQLHGTTKYADELKAALKSTNSEIKTLIDDYESLTINRPVSKDNIDNLKNEADAVKAAGVVSLNEYDYNKRVLDANQTVGKQQETNLNQQVNNRRKLYTSLLEANTQLTAAQKAYDANSSFFTEDLTEESNKNRVLRERLQTLQNLFKPSSDYVKGLGLSNEKQKEFNTLLEGIQVKAGATARETAADLTKINASILAFLGRELDASKQALVNQVAANLKELAEAEAKIRQANDKEQQTLARQNRDSFLKLQQQQLEDLEKFGGETEKRIRDKNNIQRDLELKHLADEKKDFEDANGPARADVLQQFQNKEAVIRAQYADKTLNDIKQFHIAVKQEQNKFYTDLLNDDLQHLKALQAQLDRAESASEQLALDTVEKERQIALKKNEDAYNASTRVDKEKLQQLEKSNEQQTQEYKDAFARVTLATYTFRQQQADINTQFDAGQVTAIETTFDKQEKIIKTNFNREISDYKAHASKFTDVRSGILRKQLEENTSLRLNAQAKLDDIKANPNSTQGQIDAAQKELNDLEIDRKQISAEIIQDTIAKIDQVKELANQTIQIIGQAINYVYQQQERLLDKQLDAQQIRVNNLVALQDRGNSELIRQEQEKLNKIAAEREKNAKKQIEINKLLQISNTAVSVSEAIGAVVAAAAKGDPYTIAARVIAAVGALVAGVISIKSAFQADSFAEGVVDYQGKGTAKSDSNIVRISRGESVITAEATQRYKPFLTAMNMLQPLPAMPTLAKDITALQPHTDFVTRTEFKEMHATMKELLSATQDNGVKVQQKIDRNGVHQLVETARQIERRKWAD